MLMARDPWVPWTTCCPLEAITPPLRAATDESTLDWERGAPEVCARLWVRAADGSVQRIPLPMGF